ncbi:MAG: hypothetical protein J7K64_02750 [Bacteroidales bacterium]|nr:hypothetical protein [Bacteroidales bacterium]
MTGKSVILKEKKPFTYQISAFTLLFFGFFFILSGFSLILGVLLSLASVFFIIMVRGTEIDFDKKKYRKVKILGSFVTGTWTDLPEIKYIQLFKGIMAQELSSPGRISSSMKISEHYILIKLIHGNNKRLTIYKTKNFDDALNKAKLISEQLNLRIYNATSRNKTWLN